MENDLPHTVLIEIREQGVEDSVFLCHCLHLLKLLLWELENMHISAAF